MSGDQVDKRAARNLGCLGFAVLIAALPLAFFGAIALVNEYKSWGLNAADCDGPGTVLMFSIPAVVIYGIGAVVNGRRFRKRLNLIVALLCLVLCAGLAFKIAAALDEQAQMTALGWCAPD